MDTKKKVIITTATMAAAVTTGAIATTAHADQVNANVNTNTNAQTTQGQSDLKTAQDQSRQNYADAKSANDAAQADLNNAKSANVNAENQQTAASAQEAQDAIAQQNAQDSVNAASDALAQAQSDAAKTASDPAAVNKAQSDANAASQANSQAQADLNQASENVKTAQDQAGKAQASVNQAQDQVTQANNNVKNASDAVSQAQTDLNNAKSHQQALSDAQQAVTSAQSQKDAADTNVNNAQNDFNSKQSATNSAKTNLDNAKTALDNVQKNAPVENHITVNDTYINELKKHRGQQLISNDPALDKASDDLLYASQYQSDPAAKAVAVHFDSNGVLSEADTIYATQYAAQLINEIRSQIGSPLVKINTGSIAIVRDVANAYVKDHKNAYLGHDHDALTSVGNNWNTSICESNVGDDGFAKTASNENNNTVTLEYQGLTRDDLQRGIFNSIRDFIFSDSFLDYGHTTDILGLRYTSDYNTPSNQNYMNYGNYGGIYLGVSFEYDPSDQPVEWAGQTTIHPGTFHFISEWDPDSAYAKVVEQHVEHPETGNEKYRQSQWRQEIAVPTTTDQASAIKSAQTVVNNAQSAYDAAQTALAQAQRALDQAKSSQISAQSKLAEAQANLQRVQAATPSVDDAQAKLTAAQNKLASAKQMAQNAQKALQAAQATKANADRALDQAENTLAGAKTKAANAQVALKQANDKLNAVLGANKKVEDAQAKLDAAKAALQVAKSNHDTSAKKLSEAKDAVKAAQDNLAKAQASVNQAQDQVTQANNNVKTASDDVSQAQTDLNNAKSHQQALSDAQQAVTSAQSQKDAADTNVNNAQNNFNSKQSAANSAKTNLDNAKTALDNVQKNAPVENHITVNDTYINELKKHRGQQIISNDTALDAASHELKSQNKYQSDPAAKTVAVHFDSNGVLSEADTIYATQYAAQLINEIRSQIGSPLVKINTGSIAIARDVANQYRADNLNIYNHGHDHDGLNKVQQAWNTTISESLSGDSSASDYDIDTNTQVNDYQGYTRDDLQRSVYEAITEFLFNDSLHDYGHTTDVLATRYPAEYNTPNSSDKDNNGNYYMNYGEVYLGVSFDYDTSNTPSQLGGLKVLHPGQLHFISEWDPDSAYAKVVEQHVEHPETGNEKYRQSQWRQEIAVPTATDQTSAIKSAQTAVNNAQSAYDAAQTALAQAQTALDQAKSSQVSAQNKLAEAQANLQRVQAATPSVDDAQAKLTAAQNKLASAKQMAQNAQKALENAQATKANADRALDQAENTLAGAKTKAANAQVALKQANDKLNAVLGANKKVEDAQAKLDAAKAALQVAKSNHDTSAKKLSEAKDAVKAAQDNLAKAQAHADATAKALANAKEALITDAKVYHDSVSIKPVTIHKGENVPAPEIANPTAADPTQNLVMGAYLKLAASKLDTIPTGTTAAWSNKTQLASDAQIVGNHQEGATVTFPDGSTMTLNVPLIVLDAESPVTPTNPGKPDHGKTDDHGTTPTPSKPDDGKTDNHKGGDSHTTTPATPTDHNKDNQGKTDPTKPVNPTTPSKPSDGHQTDTNKPSDNSHVTTPTDSTKTDTTTNTTLPSDAHVVDGQVVNAQGQVIPGFKVENGTIVAASNSTTTASVNTTAPVASAVTMTREQYRTSQNNKSNTDAKTLPQTGNANGSGLIALGFATLAGMFGLAAKRRNNNN